LKRKKLDQNKSVNVTTCFYCSNKLFGSLGSFKTCFFLETSNILEQFFFSKIQTIE